MGSLQYLGFVCGLCAKLLMSLFLMIKTKPMFFYYSNLFLRDNLALIVVQVGYYCQELTVHGRNDM